MATENEVKGDLSFLEKANGVVFSLPPSLAALNLVEEMKFEKKTILLSSIGVYAKDEELITEESNIGKSERSQLIYNIEKAFLKNPNAIVLRLGGLFDESRHPVKYIVKNNSTPNGNELVNFVHIDDVCEAIHILLKNEPKQRIYNLVDTNHPNKKNYYNKVSEEMSLGEIEFVQKEVIQYSISSKRFLGEFSTPERFLRRI